MHRTLEPISAQLRRGDRVTIIAFGDDITAGSTSDSSQDSSAVYHQQWRDRLAREHPMLDLLIVNRGAAADTIDSAHERAQGDVIEAGSDAVIVAFGANDCRGGPEQIDHFERELSRLVWRIRQSRTTLILMTTSMLNVRANPAATDRDRFADRTAAGQMAGWMTHYMNRVREVAGERGVPLADGYSRWQAARARGVDIHELLITGSNHPNRAGHALLADALYGVLH